VIGAHYTSTTPGASVGPDAERWRLEAGDLHVIRASLERTAEVVRRLGTLLSEDERARAARFIFDRDRDRYIVGRGLLRLLLSRYLDRGPEELKFEYSRFDKPSLAGGSVHFNLSHSHALALFAFSRDAELGVDVELDDGDFSRELIAERFFSPAEVSVLRSLDAPEQPRAFLRCWTRKEAFLKARGDGLNLPLASFDVTLHPDAPAELLRTNWSAEEPSRWSLRDLSDPEAGYLAALAIEARDFNVAVGAVPDDLDDLDGFVLRDCGLRELETATFKQEKRQEDR
jgi:4'-phosphopantetheinyl transferase